MQKSLCFTPCCSQLQMRPYKTSCSANITHPTDNQPSKANLQYLHGWEYLFKLAYHIYFKLINTAAIIPLTHRRSQDFVWGCTYFAKKLTTFFSRRPQRPSKYTSKSKPPSKNCPKIDSCSGWGCTSCPGVHLHIFPVN